ncbi:SH3 domain-containing YSC84-like protein 1 isoform 1-T1 [Anomaloglossus baeobatrachus]|uniref:SH3 domain-containing YSC84-like protein 1 isoform X1 n=1 Tax=Anomaloglossus baeobatrachus TaxID=238106 RepID=UPI003F509358
MNNPIPSNLKSEAKKAAKILREFTEISSRSGPDKIIPAHVIAKAQGLAILSVIKAGFLVTARGGSGIVLARLPDGRWSAPSAIGIAGLGGGFEIGIEVSDLVIILNHKRAVEAFAKGGNLTLGGNFTVAIGPLGRNLEGDVAIRSSAAVYTYCKSRGLFAGISLEGSGLIERKETNRKFYCQEDIRAYEILFGEIPRPSQAEELYDILDSFTEKYEIEEQSMHRRKVTREQRKKEIKSNRQRSHQSANGTEASRPTQRSYPDLSSYNMNERDLNNTEDDVSVHSRPFSSIWNTEGGPRADYVTATAIYPFDGLQPGDLSFQIGDKIIVTTKTESQYDWWEGKLKGELGIFPANYVMI